jgi:hypothetical protein
MHGVITDTTAGILPSVTATVITTSATTTTTTAATTTSASPSRPSVAATAATAANARSLHMRQHVLTDQVGSCRSSYIDIAHSHSQTETE